MRSVNLDQVLKENPEYAYRLLEQLWADLGVRESNFQCERGYSMVYEDVAEYLKELMQKVDRMRT